MARRDAFSELRDLSNDSVIEQESQTSNLISKQPLDLIPVAQPRKKRNRDWEKKHQAETVTYRGVPKEVQNWVERVADGLLVPRDEVVRAFLEFGLSQYQSGQLTIFAYPKAQRMTLYPESKFASAVPVKQNTDVQNWLDVAFPTTARKVSEKNKSKKENPASWKIRVTYRIPIQLKEEIRSMAEEHTLPVGEVVWFLIEYALKAYRDGKLNLNPVPKVIGKTLFQDGAE